jgi:hypothetical protein
MDTKRKITIRPWKSQKEYCFKSRIDKHYYKSAQIYGKDTDEQEKSEEDIEIKGLSYLTILRKIENLRPTNNTNKSASRYHRRCLKVLKVLRSLSFILIPIFFASFKESDEHPRSDLYLAFGFSILTLICEGIIQSFLFLRYRVVEEIPYIISCFKILYFNGIVSFTLMFIVLLLLYDKSDFVISISIMCLYSLGSFFIIIYNLFIGCLLFDRIKQNSFWRKRSSIVTCFLLLILSSSSYTAFINIKIYTYLIGPIDFHLPSWLTLWTPASLMLIFMHSMILMYDSLLKTDYCLCACPSFRKLEKDEGTIKNHFYGLEPSLFFAVEVLVSMKMDGILSEKTNWFIILIPAYLGVFIRIFMDICYNNIYFA